MNLPNILSVIRLCMIPVTAILFANEKITAAVIIFIAACLTDMLDGYIARKYNMITDIGKVLDPLADKGMQITMLVSMAVCDLMPWLLVMLLFLKELLMCIGGALLYKANTVIAANSYGKISTVVTSSCVVLILLLHNFLPPYLMLFLQWLPVVFAIYAFIRYTCLFVSWKKENKIFGKEA